MEVGAEVVESWLQETLEVHSGELVKNRGRKSPSVCDQNRIWHVV